MPYATEKQYPLVRVEWQDSCVPARAWSPPSWGDSVECVSIGFLIRETKDLVTVASHLCIHGDGDEVEVSGAMQIPKIAITKRTLISVRQKRRDR